MRSAIRPVLRRHKMLWGTCVLALLCGGGQAAAAVPPTNSTPPDAGWWLGEAAPLANRCNAGDWTGNGAVDRYRFEWVLDPGPAQAIVRTQVTTDGHDELTASAANVNHVIRCRVSASIDTGVTWSAPVTATTDSGADLVPPLVGVTLNGGVVKGDVGGVLTGTNTVQVRLRRDAADGTPREVDVSPVAPIDNPSGVWTATLPARAPADDRDRLVLDYSGAGPQNGSQTSSGVPPDVTLRRSFEMKGYVFWP